MAYDLYKLQFKLFRVKLVYLFLRIRSPGYEGCHGFVGSCSWEVYASMRFSESYGDCLRFIRCCNTSQVGDKGFLPVKCGIVVTCYVIGWSL